MNQGKIYIFILILGCFSCGEETLPKPKAYLTLKYPTTSYIKIASNCAYNFEISQQATIDIDTNCWATINYPRLKARIHISYSEINDNLEEILKDIEKLTFEHTIKADAIPDAISFENNEKGVFGKVYLIEGNVASNVQFSATDSTHHMISAALYFYAKPNYDSILPAVRYLEKDIDHLIESLEWKNHNK
jgi:gliding motility-associated lipoprotein GldD